MQLLREEFLLQGGDNVEWGASERMPARSGCPKGVKGGGSVLHKSFMVATSSGMGRASGLRGPVGCRDIASAGPQSSPVPARILPVANQAPIKLRACHAGYQGPSVMVCDQQIDQHLDFIFILLLCACEYI